MEPARRPLLLSFWAQAPDGAAHEGAVAAVLRLLQADTSGALRVHLSCGAAGAGRGPWAACGGREDRMQPLSRSTFTLIVTPSLTQTQDGPGYNSVMLRVLEALASGAVPVLLGSSSVSQRLPFAELLTWRRAALFLPRTQAAGLLATLQAVPDTDIAEMRRFGRMVHDAYLGSAERVAAAALASVRARLGLPPAPARREPSIILARRSPPIQPLDTPLGPVGEQIPSPRFQHNASLELAHRLFNMPGDPFYLYPSTPFSPVLPTAAMMWGSEYWLKAVGKDRPPAVDALSPSLGGNAPQEQFTVMILTYKRMESLIACLHRLRGLPYLNKVIVVWNDPTPPADDVVWPRLHVPLEVLKQRVNSLNNRFLPFDSIETDAIFSMDDDVVLSHERLVLGFKTWRNERDRLVGFFARYHKWDPREGRWLYSVPPFPDALSIMITSATFFHQYYLYMYSYAMPPSVLEFIANNMNCEDIAMNFIVQHITRKPPIKIKTPWNPHCPNCESSLSGQDDHIAERHRCMNEFAKAFGYMPLLNTQGHVVDDFNEDDKL